MAILKIIAHGLRREAKRKVIKYVLDPKKTQEDLSYVTGDFLAQKTAIKRASRLNYYEDRLEMLTQIDFDKFTYHPGIMDTLQQFEIEEDVMEGVKVREINDSLENILKTVKVND